VELKRALEIAAHCKKGLLLAGMNFEPSYFGYELSQALATVLESAKLDGVSSEEHTKLKRQYNALKARYVRLANKHGETVKEQDDDNDAS
jgi:hypothetical protein